MLDGDEKMTIAHDQVRTAFVVGGTGFVGKHLLNAFANAGIHTKVAVSHLARYRGMKMVEHCELVEVNTGNGKDLVDAMTGTDIVVNLAGILNETRGRTFVNTHIELVHRLITAAQQAGVRRYLHMSALKASAQDGASVYLQTKGHGEELALAANSETFKVTAFRPSIIFGQSDSFFNRFATLLQVLPPFAPLPLACPDSKFTPVWITDICSAFLATIDNSATAGKSLDLCGPSILSLEDCITMIARELHKNIRIIRLSPKLSRLQARVMQYIPGKPFTMDNYLSLQQENIGTTKDLVDLDITPADPAALLTHILDRNVL